MMRAALLTLSLASPTLAQTPDLPDVTQIRDDPRLDLTWVPSLELQQAIAAAEDPSWFDSFPATSTITQQVAKNYLLSTRSSLNRAAMGLQLAINMANTFSADDIISIYAQRIYVGRNCYGVPSALEHLFETPPEDASLREFITLSAVFKAPSYYDRDPDLLNTRFAFVVQEGQSAGFWSTDVAETLLSQGHSPVIDGARCPSSF